VISKLFRCAVCGKKTGVPLEDIERGGEVALFDQIFCKECGDALVDLIYEKKSRRNK